MDFMCNSGIGRGYRINFNKLERNRNRKGCIKMLRTHGRDKTKREIEREIEIEKDVGRYKDAEN